MTKRNATSKKLLEIEQQVSKPVSKAERKSGFSVIEKIKTWYFQNDVNLDEDERVVLTPTQEETRLKLKEIFALLVGGKTKTQVVEYLVNEYEISETRAYQMIAGSQELFVEANLIEREPMRVIQLEKYKRMIQLIRIQSGIDKNPDHEKCLKEYRNPDDPLPPERLEDIDKALAWNLITKIEERIDKISGLEDKEAIDPKQLMKDLARPDIQLTTDPKTLDVEHEEV